MPSSVVFQARVGTTASAAALVEEDDAVSCRIEEAARAIVTTGTAAAMYEERGLAAWVAAFLEVQFMRIGNSEISSTVRVQRRVQRAHPRGRGPCALSIGQHGAAWMVALPARGSLTNAAT